MDDEISFATLMTGDDNFGPEIFDDYSDIDSLIRITSPFFRSSHVIDYKCTTDENFRCGSSSEDNVVVFVEEETSKTMTKKQMPVIKTSRNRELRLAKKVSDVKYRHKMKEQFERLSAVVIGNGVKWRKKEVLDLCLNYIDVVTKHNKELSKENAALRQQLSDHGLL